MAKQDARSALLSGGRTKVDISAADRNLIEAVAQRRTYFNDLGLGRVKQDPGYAAKLCNNIVEWYTIENGKLTHHMFPAYMPSIGVHTSHSDIVAVDGTSITVAWGDFLREFRLEKLDSLGGQYVRGELSDGGVSYSLVCP